MTVISNRCSLVVVVTVKEELPCSFMCQPSANLTGSTGYVTQQLRQD